MRSALRLLLSLLAAFALAAAVLPPLARVAEPLAPAWAAAFEAAVRALERGFAGPTAAPAPGSAPPAPPAAPAAPPRCEVDPLLASLASLDPLEAARSALGKGDLALLGVRGRSLELPGVPAVAGDPECWARELGVVPLPDTSGAPRCAEHARLQGVARAFAERYNRAVVEELRRRAPGRCAG